MTKIFFPKWKGKDNTPSRISTFYEQPKDSVDVLFIGASSFRNGISPLLIWKNYGFTSYVRASGAQAPMISYFYLLESLKYQTPKVIVIDGVTLAKSYDFDENEGFVRIAVDPMRLSKIKIMLANEIVKHSNRQTIFSYIFPLLRYHSRWKELNEIDFKTFELDNYDPFKGSYMDLRIQEFEIPKNFMKPSKDQSPNDEISLNYYEKIIEVSREHNIDIIFVTLPRLYWSYQRYNGILNLAQKYDLEYIDYCLPENLDKVGFDSTTDFYNSSHLNIFGAQKISNHLGKYLQDNYDLPDKRVDPDYEQWNKDLEYFNNLISQEELDNPEQFIEPEEN